MPLREFTARRGEYGDKGCPNKCHRWARQVIPGVGPEPLVDGHHPNCPCCPRQKCGYCGSERGFSDGSEGDWPRCLDCGGC